MGGEARTRRSCDKRVCGSRRMSRKALLLFSNSPRKARDLLMGQSINQSIRYLRAFWILYQLLFVDAQHPKSASRSNPSASTPLAYDHRYRLIESNRLGGVGRVSWKLTVGDGLFTDRLPAYIIWGTVSPEARFH